MKKLLSIALLLTGIVLSSCEGEAQGEFFSIKNNQFWKTADGRSIYSQGGGIFKFPDGRVALSEQFHGIVGLFFVKAAVVDEGLVQRGAYEAEQYRSGRHRRVQFFQRITHAVQDPFLGVRQRAVQVKKDIPIH